MKSPSASAKRTTIHVAFDSVLIANAGDDAVWKFSIIFTGDYSCQVIAAAITETGPIGGERVEITFRSMSEMTDTAEAKLAAQPLPKAVVVAILAAIPNFLADAEIAYHSGDDLSKLG